MSFGMNREIASKKRLTISVQQLLVISVFKRDLFSWRKLVCFKFIFGFISMLKFKLYTRIVSSTVDMRLLEGISLVISKTFHQSKNELQITRGREVDLNNLRFACKAEVKPSPFSSRLLARAFIPKTVHSADTFAQNSLYRSHSFNRGGGNGYIRAEAVGNRGRGSSELRWGIIFQPNVFIRQVFTSTL